MLPNVYYRIRLVLYNRVIKLTDHIHFQQEIRLYTFSWDVCTLECVGKQNYIKLERKTHILGMLLS